MKIIIMLVCILVTGCGQEKALLTQGNIASKTEKNTLEKQNDNVIHGLVNKKTLPIRKERTEFAREDKRPIRSNETRQSYFDFLSVNSVVFDNKVKEI